MPRKAHAIAIVFGGLINISTLIFILETIFVFFCLLSFIRVSLMMSFATIILRMFGLSFEKYFVSTIFIGRVTLHPPYNESSLNKLSVTIVG